MKLAEYIESQPSGIKYFIGAKSNFLFIGNKATFIRDAELVNETIKRNHLNHIKATTERLVRLLREGEPTVDVVDRYIDSNGKWREHFIPYELAVSRYNESIDTCHKNIKFYSDYMRAYVPFSDRGIIEIQNRDIHNDGLIILIEGIEEGKYWFEHEYLKDYEVKENECK